MRTLAVSPVPAEIRHKLSRAWQVSFQTAGFIQRCRSIATAELIRAAVSEANSTSLAVTPDGAWAVYFACRDSARCRSTD